MKDTRDPETLGLGIRAYMTVARVDVLAAADAVAGNSQTQTGLTEALAAGVESPSDAVPQNGSQAVLPRSCTCSPNVISWECPWHGF